MMANQDNFDHNCRKRDGAMDRISDLPLKAIENILKRLPIGDAARTCVLSKEWRHRWANSASLAFDDTFARDLQRRRGSVSDALLITKIFEVMLLHSGPIRSFVLFIPSFKSCPEINSLILFLSTKDVHRFALIISVGDTHKLPSCMFSFLHLRRLALCSCVFKPPTTFGGFSKLANLYLRRVHLDSDFFSTFISKCPKLERLTLLGCYFMGRPNIEINSPNLGDTKVRLFLDEALNGLPAIRFLSIDFYFLWTLVVREESKNPPITLNHLKVLKVFLFSFTVERVILPLIGLIKSSPNLEQLDIEVYSGAYNDATIPNCEPSVTYDRSDFSLNKLAKVNLHSFNGTKSQMMFIKFVLSKSPALHMMHIRPHASMVGQERFEVFQELLRFRRASPLAEIMYGN